MKLKSSNILKYYSLISSLLLLIFFSESPAVVYGQSVGELYKNAGQLYKANQFQNAADTYKKILGQGYKTPEIYYNLGNCYYKTDSIGRAILNYERALKLSPKDEDVIHNLKLAHLKAIDKIQAVPQLAIITWWNEFVNFQTATGWGNISLIFIWLAIVVFAVSFFLGTRRILNSGVVLFFLLSVSFLFLAIHQKHSEEYSDEAILTVPSSFVKSAPDASANDLFIIHEGAQLHIIDHVGTWDKIRLGDGKVGWIEAGGFEKI